LDDNDDDDDDVGTTVLGKLEGI